MMLHTIQASNPDSALSLGLQLLKEEGYTDDSRNGPVLVAPGPVVTEYGANYSVVSLAPTRDANPFFHVMEAMWMLAGRNVVAPLLKYVPRMAEFSDDDKTLHGAYGYRWRNYFGYDQLEWIADELRANPDSRRCVLTMWDGGSRELSGDLYVGSHGGKDVPCNTHVYFAKRPGDALDMTVLCRSNDIVWGAYGANVVHFGLLHAWMAAAAGLRVGVMYQVSNNYHAYSERPDVRRLLDGEDAFLEIERMRHMPAYEIPLLLPHESASSSRFLDAARAALDGTFDEYFDFIRSVVKPLATAHAAYREGDFERALACVRSEEGTPLSWLVAARAWLRRRQAAAAKTEEVR